MKMTSAHHPATIIEELTSKKHSSAIKASD